MKHLNRILGAALLALLVVSAPAFSKTLKAAYFVSPKHPIGVGYQFLADELKRESKGQLTIRIFPGESLLGAKAISDGVRDQVADMGHLVMTYTPAYYPHGVVINDLSMVGDDDIAGVMVVTELLMLRCPACLAEMAKQNQIPLSGLTIPKYVIIGMGDFNSPEKIKLKKLRAAGSLWDRWCRSVGAVAVNMPTAGMYEAMSRGTLDGALYAIGGLKSHGLGDIAKQVIMLNTGSFRAGSEFSMNKNSWADLKPEERRMLLRSASKALMHTMITAIKTDEEGLKIAKAKNIPVVQPHPELLRMRNEFVESDLKLTEKDATEKLKLTDAAEFIANYRKLFDKYEKLVKPLGNDENKLDELLYKEVYSKIDVATYGVK